jgi:Cys-tRNA(Pro)/Cys-tRNA(Cys) deacylase
METNVTRLLAAKQIPHEIKTYEVDAEDLSAGHVAAAIGFDGARVFKTLVAVGADSSVLVFVIPGNCELDLKKAAKASGQKSITLLPLKDLEKVTGYVRGGCSPVGMKKRFPVYIDETAELWESISVSAGKRGVQIVLGADALAELTSAHLADLV